jgi:hypothetical protein
MAILYRTSTVPEINRIIIVGSGQDMRLGMTGCRIAGEDDLAGSVARPGTQPKRGTGRSPKV